MALGRIGIPLALTVCGLAALLVSSGCSESSSDGGRSGPAGKTVTRDTKPWQSDPKAFGTGQFKQGDQQSWQNALRARAQSQDEYAKAR